MSCGFHFRVQSLSLLRTIPPPEQTRHLRSQWGKDSDLPAEWGGRCQNTVCVLSAAVKSVCCNIAAVPPEVVSLYPESK